MDGLFNKAKEFASSEQGQTMMNSQQGKDMMNKMGLGDGKDVMSKLGMGGNSSVMIIFFVEWDQAL